MQIQTREVDGKSAAYLAKNTFKLMQTERDADHVLGLLQCTLQFRSLLVLSRRVFNFGKIKV